MIPIHKHDWKGNDITDDSDELIVPTYISKLYLHINFYIQSLVLASCIYIISILSICFSNRWKCIPSFSFQGTYEWSVFLLSAQILMLA